MSIYVNGKKIKEDREFDRGLTPNDDVNKLYTSGIYKIHKDMYGLPQNFAVSDWCYLLVKYYDDNDIKQIVFNESDIYIRRISTKNSNMSFTKLANAKDIDNLQSQIDDLKKIIGGGK